MRCATCGQETPQLGRVCPYCYADKSSAPGVLEAAYFLIVGGGLLGWWIGGLLGWWVEGSRELLIGLGGGFALSVIITAIDIHYRKSHSSRLNLTFWGIHNLLRKRASNNYRA